MVCSVGSHRYPFSRNQVTDILALVTDFFRFGFSLPIGIRRGVICPSAPSSRNYPLPDVLYWCTNAADLHCPGVAEGSDRTSIGRIHYLRQLRTRRLQS